MDEFQLVLKALDQVRLSDLQKHATASKVPFGTLLKIKYGTTKNPRFSTVRKLADHFNKSTVCPKTGK
jgi:hypothetical protein